MTEKFDAVVVGAGPAGLATAMRLAQDDVRTLVLERGKAPGTKNASGGVLYGQTNTEHNLDALIPDFEKEAPIERPIHENWMHCLAGDKVKSLDITPLHLTDHKWSYSVLRGPFDAWFGRKVHEELRKSGGGVLSDVRVTGPIMEGDRVVGVETDELDPIHADLVVAADGATSELVRKVGLRGWEKPESWFQGAKVVVKLPDEKTVEDRFGIQSDGGIAHLFAGDTFGGVRGGGFVYTNKDTLSVGTVFHLDSLAAGQTEPHRLMDRLILHPMVQEWIGDEAEELEYSAKLIPDGKKMAIDKPYAPGFVAVGDAAGQLQAMGPVIKGMNLGISAGMIAAESFIEAQKAGRTGQAALLYGKALNKSYLKKALKPWRYRLSSYFAENDTADDLLRWTISNRLGARILRSKWGLRKVQGMMSDPKLAAANPDISFGYVTLPAQVAEGSGETLAEKHVWSPRTLEERIAALTYDTAIGEPHILLKDASPAVSGAAVTTCPVSARGFSGGCYRQETVKTPEGGEVDVVALDVQPCIECGTCALMAATDWEHPRGGKGVKYNWG